MALRCVRTLVSSCITPTGHASGAKNATRAYCTIAMPLDRDWLGVGDQRVEGRLEHGPNSTPTEGPCFEYETMRLVIRQALAWAP